MKLLNKPLKVKNMEVTNRLVIPPMATSKTADGKINRQLLDYYDEKTKGGYIGLVITEHAYVSKEGMAGKGQISISRDEDVDGLKELVKVIHNNGSKVIAQIAHAGSSTTKELTGYKPISSSAVTNNGVTGKKGVIPKEMSKDDIKRVIQCFADAGRRAKEAGFDGIEIHAAHGYLLNQFFSPLTNKRTDEYGGELEGRMKIHLEIINAIRSAVGDEYIIALRLGACDYVDGGTTLEDSVNASILFEKSGVDLLDISGGFCGYLNPNNKEQGHFSELTEAIKKSVATPVILTGGITDGEVADMLLEEGKADFIGVGRAILKDSNWAKNVMEVNSTMKKEINVFEYGSYILQAVQKGVLLTTKSEDKVNSMTISWGTLGIEWGKTIFTTFVRENRFTKEQLNNSLEFTINIPYGEYNKKILGFCGTKSGKNIDKIKELGLTLEDGVEVSVPGIKELPLTLECKVLYKKIQDKNEIGAAIKETYYPENIDSSFSGSNKDYHIEYIGEVVKAYIIGIE